MKINTCKELTHLKDPCKLKFILSVLVDCSQPATTGNFEYSGCLACSRTPKCRILENPSNDLTMARRETSFATFKENVEKTARHMIIIIDYTPIKYEEWKLHVLNNKSVVN